MARTGDTGVGSRVTRDDAGTHGVGGPTSAAPSSSSTERRGSRLGIGPSCPAGGGRAPERAAAPEAGPRPLLRAGLGGLLLLVAACASPAVVGGRTEFGAWQDLGPSWEKVEAIDRWIAAEGPSAPVERLLEATLQLAESRLELTLLDGSSLDARTRQIRLELAANGFEEVAEHPLASLDQRARAEEGLADVGRLGFRPAVAEPVPASGTTVAGAIPRRTWGARPTRSNIDRASGRWSRITVHHTAIDAGHLKGASVAQTAAALRQIQDLHQNGNGWADIGYHLLIDPEGRLFEGRPLRWQGAHAGNKQYNRDNIGICLLGDFTVERPTPRALATLEGLIESLRAQHGIPRAKVFGHEHFKNTECPGRYLASWLVRYKRGLAGVELGAGQAPLAALATSSSSASSEISGVQPRAASFEGSPRISAASSGRWRSGSSRVR